MTSRIAPLALTLVLLATGPAARAADDKAKARPAPDAAKTNAPIELFPDKVLARSTNFTIKASQVEEEFSAFRSSMAAQGKVVAEADRADIERKILDRLIVTEIMLYKATDADRAKANEGVDKFFTDMVKRTGSELALRRSIEATGTSFDNYKGKLTERAIAEQVFLREVRSKIEIPDATLKKFYDENPSRFESPEMVRASHILIGTHDPKTQLELDDKTKAERHKLAEDLLARARKGEDFAKLARDFSNDTPSKERGGEYIFPRGQMVAEFEAAAFSLNTNQVSDLVTTKFGYHIIKLSEKIPAKKTPYAEVSDKIKDYLQQQEADKLLPAYLEKIKKEAGLEYLVEKPKP